MVKNALYYFPYASLNNEQLPLLKVAALYFDTLYILDPVEASLNTVGAEYYARDAVKILEQEGILKRIHPAEVLKQYEKAISDAVRQDMQDKEFQDLCDAHGGGSWELALSKVPQDLQTDKPMRWLMGDFAREVAGSSARFRERAGLDPLEYRGFAETPQLFHEFREGYTGDKEYRFAKFPLALGESIMINHALFGGLMYAQATPITDYLFHSLVLSLKLRRAGRNPDIRRVQQDRARQLNADLPAMAALAHPQLDLPVLNPALSLNEVLEFRHRHEAELLQVRGQMGRVARDIVTKPWSRDFVNSLDQETIPVIEKGLREVEQARDSWLESSHGINALTAAGIARGAASVSLFLAPTPVAPIALAAAGSGLDGIKKIKGAKWLADWAKGKMNPRENGLHYVLQYFVGQQQMMEAAKAEEAVKAAAGPAPKKREARFANVHLHHPEDEKALPGKVSPAADTAYFLRLNIGPLSPESVVVNPGPVPVELLPSVTEGYWLDVIAVSHEFVLQKTRFHLFLPVTGPSWVCDCLPGSTHTCRESDRREYLDIPVRTPPKSGKASLRLCLYYRNNAVQSQLLTAHVMKQERPGRGYHSVIDYTLTEQLKDVEFLPERQLNILTNQGPDGTHTLVFKNGTEEPAVLYIPESVMNTKVKDARTALLELEIETLRGGGGKRPKTTYRYDDKNAKKVELFKKDVQQLAHAGYRLWAFLFGSYKKYQDQFLALRRRSHTTIQVARVLNNRFVFPWAMVYDITLSSDLADDRFCRIFNEWDRSPHALDSLPDRCPYEDEHRENTICPFGFWGFRTVIEQPPSTQQEADDGGKRNLSFKLNARRPLEMVVCQSNDLKKEVTKTHLETLQRNLPDFQAVPADTKQGIRKNLSNPDLEIVYFYCHGKHLNVPNRLEVEQYLEVGTGDRIFPEDINTWYVEWLQTNRSWKTTPLVFLNGCHTVEVTPECLVTFVDAFAAAGAGGIIGTEVTMHQKMAGEAAEQFLVHFGNGTAAGEALRRMRLHFLKKGNLMGLAYTAYCSADYSLVMSPS